MDAEFGTGLRSHIERVAQLGDSHDHELPPEYALAAAELAARLADVEAREQMLVAAGAELAHRERRLLEREAALIAAAQRVSKHVVENLLQVEPAVDDELARLRARHSINIA